ncbi:restriction endonuclease subunit S [Acinetobacter rathckeae]|uniref:restriction endonuclease subunit S n=1 Tax=Acinetobacter rathckeae TaxID=2605272 RepID=UPI0018A2D1B5|nr:restriction endonuclease subunit S [Acinetobacter rathckeae]MBF7687704.1 restriction endonuclease subunit S [Acinetobacter rathckeae]
MSEWKLVTLGSVCFINPKESLAKGMIAKKVGMEYLQPFTKNPIGHDVEAYNGGTKFRNGDTLVARITPCLENGKTCYISNLSNDEIAFGSTEYIVLREKPTHTDKEFLYYFARSDLFRDVAIASMTGSSGRQRVQTDVVINHEFNIPPLPEQKAIASVLSSLDDKIDLLHRQNKTLEAMAETLFQQWFVEEAKEDWEQINLSKLGEIVCGKTPSKKNALFFGIDIPFLKIPDMHGKVFVTKTEDQLSLKGSDSQIKKLIPEGSICVSCIATVGLVSITAKAMHTNQQINSIIPFNKKHKFYLYLTMKSRYEELQNLASGGTATLNLNTSNFSKIEVPLPKEDVLYNFDLIVSGYFYKIESNYNQIQTLEKLRDTLLPKLMSGEVRVQY